MSGSLNETLGGVLDVPRVTSRSCFQAQQGSCDGNVLSFRMLVGNYDDAMFLEGCGNTAHGPPEE